MEMEMNESPTMVMGNHSDDSNISFDSSGGNGGSLSPPLKRHRKASTDTTTSTVDDDDDDDDTANNKTSSTISSNSEEFNEPPLAHPFCLLESAIKRASISEEFGGALQPVVAKRICTTIEEYVTNDYSWEECKDFLRAFKPKTEPQSDIETWRVDPDHLFCYASQALTYFKETTGEDYRYGGPRSMCLCSSPDSEYKVTHMNFFARPCGETSKTLFFAALEHEPVRKVLECCSVPLSKTGDDVVPFLKHPPHVDCSECSKFGDAVLCFEVEEEPLCYIPWSSVI